MPGNEEVLEPQVDNKKLDHYLFKPVTLILSDGRRLVGTIQAITTEGKVLLLSNSMEEKLKKELGDMHQWKLPLAKALKYVEVLEGVAIREIRGENTIHSIHTVTESGKKVDIVGFEIELRLGSPGHLKVRYRLPENLKWFELGELPIREGTLNLPVTLAFVSYAKEDRDAVLALTRAINDYGVVTWFDERMLLPGDDWQRKIEAAIEEADYCLLCLSAATIQKAGYKNKELMLALEQQSLRPPGIRFIIPILLAACRTYYVALARVRPSH